MQNRITIKYITDATLIGVDGNSNLVELGKGNTRRYCFIDNSVDSMTEDLIRLIKNIKVEYKFLKYTRYSNREDK